MTPRLSDEQRQALQEQQGGPIYVHDPVNNAQYVLVPAAEYQPLKLPDGNEPFDIRDTYAAQERALGRAGWDDPALDAYNDYDAHREKL